MLTPLVQQLCDAAPRCLAVLIDAALKGFFVLLLCVGVSLLLRRASAATRHLMWFLGLTSLALLPALALMLPSWRILPADATPERVIPIRATATDAEVMPDAHWQSPPLREL